MDLRLLRYFVAVAEERHVGRAAARLHMTQPPLSRALKQLEADLGTVLLHRTPTGVTPTAAGEALFDEARTLLERADLLRARVAAAAGPASFTIGTLADSAERTGTHLAAAFRERHPGVDVRFHEAAFTDPTAGLRAGRTDVALTRAPFDDTGIDTYLLRTDAVGVVVRTDDPLARRDAVRMDDLDGRRWFQLPEGTDPLWRAYWQAATATGELRAGGPVVRTVHECQQAVLWNGTIGLSPLADTLPDGLSCVPLTDMASSRLVVAWRSGDPNPLVHSFSRIAVARYGVRNSTART
jgi:DNA-binding transcriptional LysR family regulator